PSRERRGCAREDEGRTAAQRHELHHHSGGRDERRPGAEGDGRGLRRDQGQSNPSQLHVPLPMKNETAAEAAAAPPLCYRIADRLRIRPAPIASAARPPSTRPPLLRATPRALFRLPLTSTFFALLVIASIVFGSSPTLLRMPPR